MRIFILYILFFGLCKANAQTINKNHIDSWVKKCDTSIQISNISGYILKGAIYTPEDSIKMNAILKNWIPKQLLAIDYFRADEVFPTAGLPGKFIVLVGRKGQQTKRSKKSVLTKAISMYDSKELVTSHIRADFKEPVLTINGCIIFHSNCYAELSKLKTSSIAFIHISKHPVPWEYYGQNAKNGLVQVWTK